MLNSSFIPTFVLFIKVALAAPAAPLAADPVVSHAAFDSLLQRHVSAGGKVDYKGFKTDKAALDAYCAYLSAHTPADAWTREEKMAYWINTYNAFTIKLITDNYPTKTIMNFDGGKTWDVKRIKLGDKKYSLNQIENEILRPQFKDARIHFAINCAAKSCPPLYNHAWTAETLDSVLDARTRAFINDPAHNSINSSLAKVSKIFEWYSTDFGDLRQFLNRYSTTKLKKGAVISYNEYNWNLNE